MYIWNEMADGDGKALSVNTPAAGTRRHLFTIAKTGMSYLCIKLALHMHAICNLLTE